MKNEILNFLGCETPWKWVDAAKNNLQLLLIDHAHCECKAASTAISLISAYPTELNLVHTLSRIAREEMRHFEMVLNQIKRRKMSFSHLSPSRYASALHKHRRTSPHDRLIDYLLIGAIIEARSCERFLALQPILTPDLKEFYAKLCESELRHFQVYLNLVQELGCEDPAAILKKLLKVENDLILSEDAEFRFHSGIPQSVILA
jgi:tRNA-(ms[2]io[6]A)-hydroxylase